VRRGWEAVGGRLDEGLGLGEAPPGAAEGAAEGAAALGHAVANAVDEEGGIGYDVVFVGS